MDELIKEVLESLNNTINTKSKYAIFSGKGYVPVDFSSSYFQPVKEEIGELAFVDGGNCEILSAVNFSLQFFRVYMCVYKNNILVSHKKKEFFGLINSIGKEGKIFYQTKLFGMDMKLPLFDSNDSVFDGSSKLTKVADIIRRGAEIDLASESDAQYVILDGNLRAETPFINEKLKGKKFYALSKTNELLTDSGNSAVVALNEMTQLKSWYYYPIVEINSETHDAEIVITKLHPASKYVFKLETPKKDDFSVVNVLVHNSKDPVFLGYPYGLVQADKFARVTNLEKEYFKVKFMAYSKNQKLISQYLNTINAHDILDSVL